MMINRIKIVILNKKSLPILPNVLFLPCIIHVAQKNMEMQKNIVPVLEYQSDVRSKSTEKDENGNMTVDEYIALVRKALDKRYESL